MAKAPPKKKSFGKKSSSRKKYAFNVKDAEGRHLVIVESPTKAKTINKYLGRDYHVMASVGHVRDLPKSAPKGSSKEDQVLPGVDLARNFEPTYEILPDKKDTVANLRKAAKVATDVYFATDLDREGEAIAWHLAEALKVPTDQAKRVVFNAITKSALEAAFASPRGIAIPRVDAQQTRRILDRIVGYQVSPLLWRKVAGGLSAGRVQSVATRLVVERERAIEAFIPDEFWKLTGFFTPEMADAGKLGDAWRSFLKESGEDVTIKDQNGWLSENGVLRAELDTVRGKKWKSDDREAALALAESLGFVLDDAVETEHPDEKGPAQKQVTLRRRHRQRAGVPDRQRGDQADQAPPVAAVHHLDAAAAGQQLPGLQPEADDAGGTAALRGHRPQGQPRADRPHHVHADRLDLPLGRGDRCRPRLHRGQARQELPARGQAAFLQVQQQGRAGGPRGDPPHRRDDHALVDPESAFRGAVPPLRPHLAPLRRLPDGRRGVRLDLDHHRVPRKRRRPSGPPAA